MSEMLKDLEMIDAEAAEFLLDSYPGRYVKHVAACLEELGYRKVVRCGECKFKKHCEQLIGNTATGWTTSIDYCSAGERVVAKNATTETSVPAPEKAE